MFIGREQELSELCRRDVQKGFQFVVIYGRRRVGKTRLIREFVAERRSVYFMATEKDSARLLAELSAEIKARLPDESTRYLDSFPSWEALFQYIGERARQERLVFTIDEYPYLAKALPEISSVLQKFIDEQWRGTNLYLILCGSSMSFMERQVLGYQSPLYGRRTAQLLVRPLLYDDSARFFPAWSAEERLMSYGVCGGVPQYLEYFSRYDNLRDAVMGEFLMLSGHLCEEPKNLMNQELREPLVYNSIVEAVARGMTKQNEIAQAVGKENNQITSYLKNLLSLEIISRKIPVGERNARKTAYVIGDNLYRFWFFFMPRCASMIAMGLPEMAYDRVIEPLFSDYFGHVFEDVCLQFLKKQIALGALPMLYDEFGWWQGANPKLKRTEDIDIVLSGKNDLLVGECKWRNDPVGMDTLETLKMRGELIRNGRTIVWALFSRAGSAAEVKKTAQKATGVRLYGVADLLP
ncbi:MAG: ATP-binding protein [Pyramidobacter sp.]|nr:ATP-binding protein [Pyramidobacter sp.]